MTEPGFLAVRLGSLGDIVHTFPAVAALRESFPSVHIAWLTHPRWKFLVETSRLADEIQTVDSRSLKSVGKAISQLKQNEFRAAIDYQGLFKSALLPFLGGVRKRIGFSSETVREYGVPILYTDRVRVASTHIADQNGELSQRAGAQHRAGKVELCIPASDQEFVQRVLHEQGIERYLVLSPGGGWRAKCWPADRFGQLAAQIHTSLGFRCVINYGPGEEDLAETIRANAGAANPFAFCGTLGQLMALLRSALGVIAGDTGPLHLADALHTPVVGIYGPTNPERNGLYFQEESVLRAPNAETTHKRLDISHPSLLQISVEDVFDVIRKKVAQ